MATGKSDRALLIIGMTRFALDPIQKGALPEAGGLIPYIQGELRYFRERGRPVIFICADQVDDVAPTDFVEALTPRPAEPIVVQKAPNAFFDTRLQELLEPLEVGRLTLVGIKTNTEILLTAADAIARGYQVVVPDPCVAAADEDDHHFALRQIREVWQRPADVENSGTIPLHDDGVDAPVQ
jgi:nicotinamidase-related amidase